MSLDDTLSTILGVVEPPPAPKVARAKHRAPPKPTPMYEFRVRLSRVEYGTAWVTAADEEDARDDYGDVDWYDSGDTEVDDVERESDEPANQDDLDHWEAEYGDRFDEDGDPICSDCASPLNANELADVSSNDPWYCADCAQSHT